MHELATLVDTAGAIFVTLCIFGPLFWRKRG